MLLLKPWLMNWTYQAARKCINEKRLRKKVFVFLSQNIISYIIKLPLTRRCSVSGEQKIVTKEFLEKF